MKTIVCFVLAFACCTADAQYRKLEGQVLDGENGVHDALVYQEGLAREVPCDSMGRFRIPKATRGKFHLYVQAPGYQTTKVQVEEGSTDLSISVLLKKNSHSLEEFVVTGASGSTRIRENPLAIHSISRKQLYRNTEANIMDALVKNVPGLTAVKTGPNVSKPFIRGLGYNRVLTLYDGLRQEGQQWGDEHGIELNGYNLQKVEVIKGPSSLMFGSDALAGIISFIPHEPTISDGKIHGSFTTEYQTNNNLSGHGLTIDYAKNKVLLSLSGSWRQAKNYQNPVDGRVYLTAFLEKTASLMVGYKTKSGSTHMNLTVYDNLQGIPDGSRDSASRKFTKQIYEAANDTLSRRPIVSDKELNSYSVPALAQSIRHIRLYTQGQYQLKKGRIDFLAGVQQNDRREYNHPTAVHQAGMDVRLRTLNYQLRYQRQVNSWTIHLGANGMLQQNESRDATDFPIPDYQLADGGVYSFVHWKGKRWTMAGGIRFDIRKLHWFALRVGTDAGTGFTVRSSQPTDPLQFADHEKLFTGISASIGTTWKITDAICLKANIGRAYRAPNITELASNGLDPGAHMIYKGDESFQPEFSLQEDLGVLLHTQSVSAELNIFNNHIQNYIYLSLLADAQGNALTDQQGNKTWQYQQSSAQLFGLEAWCAFHPRAVDNLTWTNTLTAVFGYNRNHAFKGEGTDGEYLPFIPPIMLRSKLSKTVNLKHHFISSVSPEIEIEHVAAQNRYYGLNQTEIASQDYTLCHAGMSTELACRMRGKILLQVSVNNLFDVAYQSNLSRLRYFEYYSLSPNGRYGIYDMGRNVCLKLVATF